MKLENLNFKFINCIASPAHHLRRSTQPRSTQPRNHAAQPQKWCLVITYDASMGHTTYNLIQLVLVLLAHDVGGTRHHFQPGDRIDLWANTIGPLNNPSETYEYYSIHFTSFFILFTLSSAISPTSTSCSRIVMTPKRHSSSLSSSCS